jgi:aminotransferase
MIGISQRVQGFTESVIREMTRVNNQYDGINLAQGMPNFPPPRELVEAAHRALDGDFHQYAITWGTPRLRRAICEKYRRFYGMELDPERHVTVCCGSTETMLATLLAVLNPGDEVIIFEPFYENYGPGCIIAGAKPIWVPLEPPDFGFDPDRLARAVTPRTGPSSSTAQQSLGEGLLPSRAPADRGRLPQARSPRHHRRDLRAHRLQRRRAHAHRDPARDGRPHRHHLGISKSYSVTGWRVGYAIASAELSLGIRRAHDFITVGAPHPLQEAAVTALEFPDSYYTYLRESYQARRDLLFDQVEAAGFIAWKPRGAYYILTEAAHFMKRYDCADDTAFAMHLIKEVGVATVPGSSFYAHAELGRTKIRFCFPKTDDMLIEAGRRLQKLAR